MSANIGLEFTGCRVLIIGGSGFIGSNIARRLVELGASVSVMDNMTPSSGANSYNLKGIEDRLLVHISDIRSFEETKRLVKNMDVIFDLAALTGHVDSMKDPAADLDVNLNGQLCFLESCRRENRRARIIFTSTRQVYGKPLYLPVDEKHPLNPPDMNAIHKLAAEHYHLLYTRVYGMSATVIRLTNTFGPRMRIKDSRQNFLGLWVRAAAEGHSFEVWGGSQLRDYSFVDDTVDALLLAALTDNAIGRVFNLGAHYPTRLLELANVIARIGGCTFVVKSLPEERKNIDIGDSYSDTSLISRTLGWAPKVATEEGLLKTIDYFKENLKHYV